jgi:hypothetical protein
MTGSNSCNRRSLSVFRFYHIPLGFTGLGLDKFTLIIRFPKGLNTEGRITAAS